MTGAAPLTDRVQENMRTQFGMVTVRLLSPFNFYITGNLEKFLKDQCNTVEFQDQMATIEEVCHVEHHGSTIWKDINLLVIF